MDIQSHLEPLRNWYDALEKRATSLESTAARLTQTSKELEASLDLLDMRTHELSSMVDKLLEDSEKHASLIGTLQSTAGSQMSAQPAQ